MVQPGDRNLGQIHGLGVDTPARAARPGCVRSVGTSKSLSSSIGVLLDHHQGRPQGKFGVAVLRRLARRAPVQIRLGRLGPQVAVDVLQLLVPQPLQVVLGRPLGREPFAPEGQMGLFGHAHFLGPRVRRGDRPAGDLLEPLRQSFEPAVVERLDRHDLLTEPHPAFQPGQLVRAAHRRDHCRASRGRASGRQSTSGESGSSGSIGSRPGVHRLAPGP